MRVGVAVATLAAVAACTGGTSGSGAGAPRAPSTSPVTTTASAAATGGAALVLRLQEAVRRVAGEQADEVVVAVARPAEGTVAEAGREVPVRGASTIKLLIYQARARTGPMSAADLATARAMIQRSDNAAATTLWRQAGGTAALAAEVRRLRLGRTTSTAPLLEPWDGWLTTARDLVSDLAQVATSPAPSDRTLLQLMEGVQADQRWGVGRLAPPGKAAVKNGWLPVPGHGWVVITAGCVEVGTPDPTCLAVTTSGSPSFPAGVRLVDAVTSAAYSVLGGG